MYIQNYAIINQYIEYPQLFLCNLIYVCRYDVYEPIIKYFHKFLDMLSVVK